MLRADNDNGPRLRLRTIDLTLRDRINAFRQQVGIEDDEEFLELALTAYEEYGTGAHVRDVTVASGHDEFCLPLSRASRHSLAVARMRSGLSEAEIGLAAVYSLLGCATDLGGAGGRTQVSDA